MDARLESSVDVLDPVRREEEDAFVIFKDAKEDFCFLCEQVEPDLIKPSGLIFVT